MERFAIGRALLEHVNEAFAEIDKQNSASFQKLYADLLFTFGDEDRVTEFLLVWLLQHGEERHVDVVISQINSHKQAIQYNRYPTVIRLLTSMEPTERCVAIHKRLIDATLKIALFQHGVLSDIIQSIVKAESSRVDRDRWIRATLNCELGERTESLLRLLTITDRRMGHRLLDRLYRAARIDKIAYMMHLASSGAVHMLRSDVPSCLRVWARCIDVEGEGTFEVESVVNGDLSEVDQLESFNNLELFELSDRYRMLEKSVDLFKILCAFNVILSSDILEDTVNAAVASDSSSRNRLAVLGNMLTLWNSHKVEPNRLLRLVVLSLTVGPRASGIADLSEDEQITLIETLADHLRPNDASEICSELWNAFTAVINSKLANLIATKQHHHEASLVWYLRQSISASHDDIRALDKIEQLGSVSVSVRGLFERYNLFDEILLVRCRCRYRRRAHERVPGLRCLAAASVPENQKLNREFSQRICSRSLLLSASVSQFVRAHVELRKG